MDEGGLEPVCFRCGEGGHKSPDCPSERTYQAGKDAKKARMSRSASPEVKKAAVPKNAIDTQPANDLGTPWAPSNTPYYTFSAVPKSGFTSSGPQQSLRVSQPPSLVPSNLV